MRQLSQSRTILLTTAALGGLLLMRAAALAQTVQIFDEAPSVEQLRSIMIPKSRGGQTRSIVLMRPDAAPGAGVTQVAMRQPVDPPAARQTAQTDPAPAATEASPTAATPARVTPVASRAASHPAPQDAAGEAGIVGFHISFALDSAALPDTATVFIDRMADLMKQAPQVRLRVEGHTDARGTAAYNQDLRAAGGGGGHVSRATVWHCGQSPGHRGQGHDRADDAGSLRRPEPAGAIRPHQLTSRQVRNEARFDWGRTTS